MESAMVRRPRPTLDPKIADVAPSGPELTDYDYTMFICYIRMLDAEKESADWRDVARILLGVDPNKEYARAKRMYDTHMARARWLTEHGYRQILAESDDDW